VVGWFLNEEGLEGLWENKDGRKAGMDNFLLDGLLVMISISILYPDMHARFVKFIHRVHRSLPSTGSMVSLGCQGYRLYLPKLAAHGLLLPS
jgi:hypothetical protein